MRSETNYSSCTVKSRENICSSSSGDARGKRRKDRMKLSLPPKLMVLGPNFTLQITLISTILNDLEFPLPKLLKSINGSKEQVVTNHVQAHNKSEGNNVY
jgi:hypothetical protein